MGCSCGRTRVVKDNGQLRLSEQRGDYVSDPIKLQADMPAPEPVQTPGDNASPLLSGEPCSEPPVLSNTDIHSQGNLSQGQKLEAGRKNRKSVLEVERDMEYLVKDSLQGVYSRAIALETESH